MSTFVAFVNHSAIRFLGLPVSTSKLLAECVRRSLTVIFISAFDLDAQGQTQRVPDCWCQTKDNQGQLGQVQ